MSSRRLRPGVGLRCFLPRLSASEWSSVIIKPPKQNRNAWHPPRHLLQPLWHPKWRAPLALYSRTHLASILDDPCARKHAFSPFALWAISAALLTGFLVVPLPLSRQLPPLRREPAWAQLESLRRPLDHVIALADCKRVLPRDLARFIHGVHGWPSLQALTNLTSLLKLDSHDAVRSLQSAPSLNGAIWTPAGAALRKLKRRKARSCCSTRSARPRMGRV